MDDGNDVIHLGAFAKTLQERGARVRVLWQHNRAEPIGKPLLIEEHGRDQLPEKVLARAPDAVGGLFTKTKISETRRGKDALVLIGDGVIDELSIGYDPVKFDFDEEGKTRIRHLREIRLWEYSPVTWGMNEAAVIVKVVDITENMIRIRIFDPDKCQEGSFRTITLDKKRGIQATICRPQGQNTTRIQAVLFDKEKWTVERAKRWVEEHRSELGKGVSGPSEAKFVGSPRNPFGSHCSFRFKGGMDGYKAAWRCHFSKVGGGATTGAASGPIRGTVRRCAMIAAAMKPKCNLPSTESIGARTGPKSPLKCNFPSKPSDYGLSSWLNASDEGIDPPEKAMRFTCQDLALIKRAALAEIKRRAEDREKEGEKAGGGIYAEPDPLIEDVWLIALSIGCACDIPAEDVFKLLEVPSSLVAGLDGKGMAGVGREIYQEANRQMAEAIDTLNAILTAAEPQQALTANALESRLRKLRALELELELARGC